MDELVGEYKVRRVGHQFGYGHELNMYEIDYTFYGGEPANEFDKERMIRVARALFERPGIGGSYLDKGEYEGLVSTFEVEGTPWSPRPKVYGVHRFRFTVRTQGTD